jgi:hypothetical protein
MVVGSVKTNPAGFVLEELVVHRRDLDVSWKKPVLEP